MSQAAQEDPVQANAAHILVIDDDERIRQLTGRYLKNNGFRVTTARDAADARKKMAGLSFDLLVLDVMMPGESGLQFATSLRQASDIPVLMLTARTESGDRISGLETGVDDYLTKPFEPRELVLRIRSILKRSIEPEAERTVIKMGATRFYPARGELVRDGTPIKLTSSELALMRLFAAAPGTPISRAELCEPTGAGQERSVDVQINRLRRKIETNLKLPVYLQTVRGVGYVLMPD